ncbi:MAG: hypothetical protein ACM3ZF_17140 [Mycobacterium leprae]
MRERPVGRLIGTALLACALLALALVGGGCAGGGTKAGPGGTGATAGIRAIDLDRQGRDNVRGGGTLVWALDQFSTQWNYNQVNGPEGSTADVLSALLPSPFRFDEKANASVWTDYVTKAVLTARRPQRIPRLPRLTNDGFCDQNEDCCDRLGAFPAPADVPL